MRCTQRQPLWRYVCIDYIQYKLPQPAIIEPNIKAFNVKLELGKQIIKYEINNTTNIRLPLVNVFIYTISMTIPISTCVNFRILPLIF